MSRALPKAIIDFVKSQPTRPIGELLAGWKFQTKRSFPYQEYIELLDAIRQHRRLKNFLMSGGPPGYLLIKESSDPWNFIKRCRECGFEIELPQR